MSSAACTITFDSLRKSLPWLHSLTTTNNNVTMKNYSIRGKISAGAHGLILKAVEKDHDGRGQRKKFAIKRVFIKNLKFPVNIIREIKSLQLLNGRNHVCY